MIFMKERSLHMFADCHTFRFIQDLWCVCTSQYSEITQKERIHSNLMAEK